MKEIAHILSEGMPFVRVDLYEVNGKIYFGELTLYHNNGTADFYPDKWNDIFGQYINLNFEKTRKNGILF